MDLTKDRGQWKLFIVPIAANWLASGAAAADDDADADEYTIIYLNGAI